MDSQPTPRTAHSPLLVIGGIVLLWAAGYLPGLGARDLRLEEGRRATPAREMLATGDFVLPRLYGDPYLSKPPLFFWVIAGFGSLLGEVNVFATRIPSVLAVLGCVFLILCFTPRRLPFSTRAIAGLMLLAAPVMLDKGTLGEIEAFLFLLVLAAWAIWWHAQGPGGTSWTGWLGAGFVLGLSVLTKGPAGPMQFYPAVAGFLLVQGRWRELFGLKHLCAVVLMLVPCLVWVAALLASSGLTAQALVGIWIEQLGVHQTVATSNQIGGWYTVLLHVREFTGSSLQMVSPWLLIALPAFRAGWGRRLGLDEPLRRFLVCAIVGNFLLLVFYPAARPRYMIAILFPVCLLAAQVVAALSQCSWRPSFKWHGNRIATLLSRLPLVIGMGMIFTAVLLAPAALPAAIALLGLAGGWAWWSAPRRGNLEGPSPLPALVRTLAVTIVLARGAVCSVLLPYVAERDANRQARESLLASGLHKDDPVYTTRVFPGRGEDCYNLQFYVSTRLRGVREPEAVLAHAPCLAVMTPSEAKELSRRSGVKVSNQASVMARGTVPLVLVRVEQVAPAPARKTPDVARQGARPDQGPFKVVKRSRSPSRALPDEPRPPAPR